MANTSHKSNWVLLTYITMINVMVTPGSHVMSLAYFTYNNDMCNGMIIQDVVIIKQLTHSIPHT